MADDRYHEFQLGGKQLAFLFMSATAVVVVSFLVGVMVGRGVHTAGAAAQDPAVADIAVDPPVSSSGSEAGESTDDLVASRQDDYTYYERLNRPTKTPEAPRAFESVREPEPVAPVNTARAAASSGPGERPAVATERPSVPAPAAERPPASAPAERPASQRPAAAAATLPAEAPSRPQPSSLAEPAGAGFFVQVLSLTSRQQAETERRKLESKGYRSYVQPTSDGRFRVRVGNYRDRDEAVSVARRLETVEKYNKPWVDR